MSGLMKRIIAFLCIGALAVMLLLTGCADNGAGEKGNHRVNYRSYIFPEFLQAMYSQRVAPLM